MYVNSLKWLRTEHERQEEKCQDKESERESNWKPHIWRRSRCPWWRFFKPVESATDWTNLVLALCCDSRRYETLVGPVMASVSERPADALPSRGYEDTGEHIDAVKSCKSCVRVFIFTRKLRSKRAKPGDNVWTWQTRWATTEFREPHTNLYQKENRIAGADEPRFGTPVIMIGNHCGLNGR